MAGESSGNGNDNSGLVFLVFNNTSHFRQAHAICWKAMSDEELDSAKKQVKYNPPGSVTSLQGAMGEGKARSYILLVPGRYVKRVDEAGVSRTRHSVEEGAALLSDDDRKFLKGKEQELGLEYRF
jgi:hypothetical protein